MTRNARFAAASAAAILALSTLVCAHASRPRNLSIEDYSGGTSRLVSEYSSALDSRDAAGLDRFFAADFALRPAASAEGPAFESLTRLRVERFTSREGPLSIDASEAARIWPGKGEPGGDAPAPRVWPSGAMERDEALAYLRDRRARFQSLARDETRLAGLEGRGDRRTLVVHTRLAGPAEGGARRQDESWWRWTAVRRPGGGETAGSDGAGGWILVAAVEEARTVVVAPEPLYGLSYPEGTPADWKAATKRPDANATIMRPGAHDAGGVAVVPDCFDGGTCLLVGGGDVLAALAQGLAGEGGPFVDRARSLGLDQDAGPIEAILTADFDNDGLPEVFVSRHGAPCGLYLGRRVLQDMPSEGRRVDHLEFKDVTEAAGLGGLSGPSRTAVALDADRDGKLDLYVVQYGDASKTGPAAGGRNGLPNRLFRNVTEPGGPVRFVDASGGSGADDTGWGLSAAAADYDADGRPDLYVTNEFGPDRLLRNRTEPGGPIRFEDVTRSVLPGDAGSGMGAAWGDYDLDGDLDLFVTRAWFDEGWILTHPMFPRGLPSSLRQRTGGGALFRNDVREKHRFSLVSDGARVWDGGWSWGAAWTDADGDGLQDLAVVGGMLIGRSGKGREIDFWNRIAAGWKDFSSGSWTIDLGEDGLTGPQDKRLFLNLGEDHFADVAYAAGIETTADLRGLVSVDITSDGAPDLVAGTFLNSPVVYENANLGTPVRVRVQLRGSGSNAQAVGAVVRLTGGGRVQTRQVAAGGSYLSDPGPILDFGLGATGAVEKVEVRWPSGKTSTVEHPQFRRGVIHVEEPEDAGAPAGSAEPGS